MYRNDLDAALARIDALELELDQSRADRNRLSKEVAQKRARPLIGHKTRKAVGAVVIAALCAMSVYLRVHHSQTAAAAPATHMDEYGAIDNPARGLCELP